MSGFPGVKVIERGICHAGKPEKVARLLSKFNISIKNSDRS